MVSSVASMKSSFFFIVLNLVRLLTIVAIAVALAGEIIFVINNVKGFNASLAPASSTTTSSSAYAAPTITAQSAIRTGTPANARRSRERRELVAGAATPSSSSGTSSVTTSDSKATSSCAYVAGTDIPSQIGGALFSVTSSIFICILLLFSFVAEASPFRFTQTFWNYAFPAYSDSFSTAPLGFIMLIIGCSILSHAVSGITSVGGWFVFVVGFVNIVFGLSLSTRTKSLRSFSPAASPLPVVHSRDRISVSKAYALSSEIPAPVFRSNATHANPFPVPSNVRRPNIRPINIPAPTYGNRG